MQSRKKILKVLKKDNKKTSKLSKRMKKLLLELDRISKDGNYPDREILVFMELAKTCKNLVLTKEERKYILPDSEGSFDYLED